MEVSLEQVKKVQKDVEVEIKLQPKADLIRPAPVVHHLLCFIAEMAPSELQRMTYSASMCRGLV